LQLPVNRRAALELSITSALLRGIAQIMDCPVSTVKTRMHKARQDEVAPEAANNDAQIDRPDQIHADAHREYDLLPAATARCPRPSGRGSSGTWPSARIAASSRRRSARADVGGGRAAYSRRRSKTSVAHRGLEREVPSPPPARQRGVCRAAPDPQR
jgi:hypothetical protein